MRWLTINHVVCAESFTTTFVDWEKSKRSFLKMRTSPSFQI